MKNAAKTFAKRIQKARRSFSAMGEMLIQLEIDTSPREFLLDVQDALANLNAPNYPALEAAIQKKAA